MKTNAIEAIKIFSEWANQFNEIEIEDKSNWSRIPTTQKFYAIK